MQDAERGVRLTAMEGSKSEELTVAVVDDDRDLRVTLVRGLKKYGINCHPVASAKDLLDALEYLSPDCILLDLQMPGMNGLDLLAAMPRELSHIPVIIFSSHGDIPAAVDAMRKGAVEFLEKPMSIGQINERIRNAVASATEDTGLTYNKRDATRLLGSLSPRESQVAQLVAKGWKNNRIAADLGISPRTVEVHRSNAHKKLNVSGVAELVMLMQSADR